MSSGVRLGRESKEVLDTCVEEVLEMFSNELMTAAAKRRRIDATSQERFRDPRYHFATEKFRYIKSPFHIAVTY